MARQYPIPAPEDDARFTFGLTLDVAEVLAAHGYPSMTDPYDGAGADFVDLQDALFGFLYRRPGPVSSAVDDADTDTA